MEALQNTLCWLLRDAWSNCRCSVLHNYVSGRNSMYKDVSYQPRDYGYLFNSAGAVKLAQKQAQWLAHTTSNARLGLLLHCCWARENISLYSRPPFDFKPDYRTGAEPRSTKVVNLSSWIFASMARVCWIRRPGFPLELGTQICVGSHSSSSGWVDVISQLRLGCSLLWQTPFLTGMTVWGACTHDSFLCGLHCVQWGLLSGVSHIATKALTHSVQS